jgi:hypothetical protein
MANQSVFGPPSFGASGGSPWNFLDQFGDEEFRKALGEAWSGAGAGYQAADTPFSLSGSAGGGRAMPRPQPLQMQGMGSLFGGYNPYLNRRRG